MGLTRTTSPPFYPQILRKTPQFLLISQNRRCSMGFHFDVAGG